MTLYTCSYKFNGRNHIVHVYADNPLDASRRLRAIGMTGKVDGELVAEMPAGPIGLMARLARWVAR